MTFSKFSFRTLTSLSLASFHSSLLHFLRSSLLSPVVPGVSMLSPARGVGKTYPFDLAPRSLAPGGPCAWRPLWLEALGVSPPRRSLILSSSLLDAPSAGSSLKLSTLAALASLSLAPGDPCFGKLLEALGRARPRWSFFLAPSLLEAPSVGGSQKLSTLVALAPCFLAPAPSYFWPRWPPSDFT